MKIIKGSITTSISHIAIVVSRVNYLINKNLLEGAIDILERVGKINSENISVVWTPGAFELPLIAKTLITTKTYQAIIGLASIIAGDTSHFKYIATECNSKLMEISINYDIPITCGILTTENVNQAIERAGVKHGNKGSDAALAALEMINIISTIKSI
uniref:6,7-dimethyl-8-ribityllumazine synthase n=1 Tax=Candidatus Aschnera chinzeii TaxID=1485666 RepID=A0AAT9G4F3_9ENTR|nr:MAG: 6,7-dimethyl-8-ribityllumazine synthase [Candidatus Aschnera chinzeii]